MTIAQEQYLDMIAQGDYFAVPAVSNSFLTAYKRELMALPPLKAGEAFRFGGGFHQALLEPHRFDWTQYRAKERIKMMRMIDAVRERVTIAATDKLEQEYYFEAHGFRCKAKIDIVQPGCVIDVKTTAATEEVEFLEACLDYDYDRQAAWYLDVPQVKEAGIDRFVIVAVTKSGYDVFVQSYERADAFVEAGREQYLDLIGHLQQENKYAHLKINNK